MLTRQQWVASQEAKDLHKVIAQDDEKFHDALMKLHTAISETPHKEITSYKSSISQGILDNQHFEINVMPSQSSYAPFLSH